MWFEKWKAYKKQVKEKTGKSFTECTAKQQEDILHSLEGKSGSADLLFFYNNIKRLTIQAYTTSQYYLTKVHVYELVPARYNGCMPVKDIPAKPS